MTTRTNFSTISTRSDTNTAAIPTNPTMYDPDVFNYCTVEFPDKSLWMIRRPLSEIKLQQVHSPCEASQVFAADWIEDPSGKYDDEMEGVIKIKFQEAAPTLTLAGS